MAQAQMLTALHTNAFQLVVHLWLDRSQAQVLQREPDLKAACAQRYTWRERWRDAESLEGKPTGGKLVAAVGALLHLLCATSNMPGQRSCSYRRRTSIRGCMG